jgi:pimeloyl-ACP methyl ester carboxylesterase
MTLHVTETGHADAPAIVFLHGMGVSSWMWQVQLEMLSDAYRCIAIDLPGNGESYQTEWHSLKDTAAQVAQMIRNRVSRGKADLVGLSLGGYSALQVLADHPHVVESIVVSGVATKPLPNKTQMQLLARIMSRITRWDIVINFYARMMQIPTDVIPLYRRDSKRLSSTTISRIYDELLNYHLPAELKKRPNRLLGVAGDLEVAAIKDGLKDLASATNASVSAIAPNAHHGWNGEHPQLFTDMVRAWVMSQPLPVELKTFTSHSSLAAAIA